MSDYAITIFVIVGSIGLIGYIIATIIEHQEQEHREDKPIKNSEI